MKEIERAAKILEQDPARLRSVLEYMFALGEECAREDAMHAACLGFSQVRAEREAMMRSFT